MIGDHYTETVVVNRLGATTGNKKRYTEHIASLACNIQPLDQSITGDIEGGFGKDYLLFCSNQDIQEGDRIIYNSTEYRIVGIENYDTFLRKARHMEIVIRAFKS